jgi:hypothetical protein
METIKWINDNLNFLNLIPSVVIAIATVAYTVRLILDSVRRKRQEIDPKINVAIVHDTYNHYYLHLVVENIGNGPAYNIKFNVKNEINIKEEERKINRIGYIRNGLKSIPAKTKRTTVYLKTLDVDARIFCDQIEIDIEYENKFKRKFRESIELDLSYIADAEFINSNHQLKMVDELQEISKTFKQIVQKNQRILE